MRDSVFPEPPDRRLELARGACAFRRGDRASAVFVIERGRVRLERTLEDGTALTLATLSAGAALAEAALFSPEYHCDAVAELPCRLAVYGKERVLQALEEDRSLALSLLERLARQVRDQRALLELRNVRSASERVMRYLHLVELLGLPGGNRPLKDLAAEIGLSPEAFYRTLSRLDGEGRIRRDGRSLQLVERPNEAPGT